jgi:hypothetical protein
MAEASDRAPGPRRLSFYTLAKQGMNRVVGQPLGDERHNQNVRLTLPARRARS